MSSLPRDPYGVRELLRPRHPAINALVFSLAFVWTGLCAGWLSAHLARRVRWGWLLVPLVPFVAGLGAFHLLWFAVREESIRAVVGSSSGRRFGNWLMVLRMIGLQGVLTTWVAGLAYSLSAMRSRGRSARGDGARALLLAAAASVVAWWSVVGRGSQDALGQLTPGGPTAAVWLSGLCVVTAVAIVALAFSLATRKAKWILGASLLGGCSVGVGMLLAQRGFSSGTPGLANGAGTPELLLARRDGGASGRIEPWLRWALAHGGAIVVGALSLLSGILVGSAAPPAEARREPADVGAGQRRLYAVATLLWMGALVYGSGFPFRPSGQPLSGSVEEFVRQLTASMWWWRNADMVVNLLMGLILALAAAGWVMPRSRLAAAVGTGLLILLGVCVFGFALEYLQVFLEGRTSSAQDILSQVVGGAMGLLAWACFGDLTDRWATRLASHRRKRSWRWMLGAYMLILLAYEWYPFVPRPKLSTAARKYRAGMILLDPLHLHGGRWDTVFLQGLFFVPLGAILAKVLHVRRGKRVLACGLMGLLIALGVEFGKIWIPGRWVTTLDIWVATVCCAAGALIPRNSPPPASTADPEPRPRDKTRRPSASRRAAAKRE